MPSVQFVHILTLINIWVSPRGAPPAHVYPPRRTNECSTLDLRWVVGGFSLVHSFFGCLHPFRCRTFNIYILYYLVETLFSIFFWKWFFCGNQKFFSRIGFTEMSTMLKICMAFFVLFSFTYAHGHSRASEKSISLYPPIRNKYRFSRTSGVWTFQNSSDSIVLNVAVT